MTNRAPFLFAVLAALAASSALAQPTATTPAPAPDPWVAKNRVLVLTDIANEPDD